MEKIHIPIFVGSTFTDMKAYRSVVTSALSQLETIVRGMEHFGSRPERPLLECLKVVRSCKVYIGIFGMRYGSIPDGYDKSMTQLEYEEAQKRKLPSLIYIIDEENQPILPKFVETGAGAIKLRELKEQLTKRHTVSFFTSPQDLRSKILYDVPNVLKGFSEKIVKTFEERDKITEDDLLENFHRLPKMFSGRELTVDFINSGEFRPAYSGDCKALGLEIGATVVQTITLPNEKNFQLYIERDQALSVCKLPKGARISARVLTAFGIQSRVDYHDDGAVSIVDSETGLIMRSFQEIKSNKKKNAAHKK